MLATIDIGNTNLTIGLYEDSKLGARWRLATIHEKMPDEYGLQMLSLLQHSGCALENLEGICLSSVVPPLTSRVIQACETYLGQTPLVVTNKLKTGITILYDKPEAVGSDRIADTVAVMQLHGGGPACIIDFGTATTFNAINDKGEYLGGAIAPGIGIASNALFSRAAKLPRIDLVKPPNAIGQNTTHAMQSGLIFGYVSLVEGMIKRFKSELGEETKVIATGGLAELIATESDMIDLIDPWLTMDGIRLIWEMNQENE